MNNNFYKEIKEARRRECMKGLNEFFDHHSLDDSRKILWKWLNVSGTGQFSDLSIGEREGLLAFYRDLQCLLETVHHVKTILDDEEANTNSQKL